MNPFGSFEKNIFDKNFWIPIINFIPECQRVTFKKLNKSFYYLIKDLCVEDKLKTLASKNLIESLIKIKYFYKYYQDDILAGACLGGNLKLVQYMISKGARDLDRGLKNACMGNNLDIINYLISKGANNWNKGLKGACRGGNLEIVNYMILKGANKWNEVLKGACRGGHMNIIELIISKGITYWDYGIDGAISGCNMDIYNFIFSQDIDHFNKRKEKINSIKKLLHNIFEEGHWKLIKKYNQDQLDVYNRIISENNKYINEKTEYYSKFRSHY